MKKFFQSLGLAALASVFILYFAAEQIARSGVSCSVPNQFSNGTTADATQVNANFAALVACFANAASAGANSDITSLTGLTTPLTAGQGGTQKFFATADAGTNTVVLTTTVPSTGFSLAAGVEVCWVPGGNNTGATQINVNGTGLKNLLRYITGPAGISAGSLVGGELKNGVVAVCALYQGASFILNGRLDDVGAGKDFYYAGCPTGWAEATGTNNTYSTGNYPDIASLLSTTWGTNGGFTVMPDLRGTVAFGRDSGGSGRITVAGGNFDGTTIGNTQYRQNWTLVAAQIPSLAVSGTTAPQTVGGSQALSLHGSHAFTSSALTANHIPQSTSAWANQTSATTPTGGFPNTAGTISDLSAPTVSVTVDLTNVAYSVDTVQGSNFSVAVSGGAFTANGAGGGNSHPIIPNAAIVTKCVKL